METFVAGTAGQLAVPHGVFLKTTLKAISGNKALSQHLAGALGCGASGSITMASGPAELLAALSE